MESNLIHVLNSDDLSRKQKILTILNHENTELEVKKIIEIAVANGLRETQKWNISQILTSLGQMATKLPKGWTITNKGKKHLEEIGIINATPLKTIKPTLHKHANQIADGHTRQFVEEAISALENGLLRSAVVLSWIGAISILYEEIIKNHSQSFNQEAQNRFPKWKNAANTDDLSKMKEYDFIQILTAISVIGKNVKDELEQCLKLRNSCGHPNSLKIGESRVAAHIEILILNIYSKFTQL